ncbi:MAG: tryptophan 7-halogenase [Alphaproteobacteria bacterium]|nr:tryptophan 7-halogenase [Alphaproteobacteria bacterium]
MFDIAIIGGGPGGSTVGALVRKHDPSARVVILERARFPRDHVGESQLPPIGAILHEMGCWDAVEAAGFPIKIGATYRWGTSPELWDFEFLPLRELQDEPRPAPYAGQRVRTALQVDRARYDTILLRHAEALGCEVREETAVVGVERDGDVVAGLKLSDGSTIRAHRYIDASGHVGVLRNAMGVKVEVPTSLKNIAIWDYWENAKWAAEIGVGGTRVQVMSQAYGWLWFIPLGPTRTSIGLVCPASWYRECGKTAEQAYLDAVHGDPRISGLVDGATRRGEVEITKDWSFLAERSVGANWMLVGEAIGFADPILAAGLTLTHTGAREAAYTLVAERRGEHDRGWMIESYDATQRARIRQHIRFADFWYAANGQFSDLKEHCAQIARDSGLDFDSDAAWQWLAQGGFTHDTAGQAGIGGLDLAGMKQITQRFLGKPATWMASESNVYTLDLAGAVRDDIPYYAEGRIRRVPAWRRGERRLILASLAALVAQLTERRITAPALMQALQQALAAQLPPAHVRVAIHHAVQVLETMLSEGWVRGELDPTVGRLSLTTPDEGEIIHTHRG